MSDTITVINDTPNALAVSVLDQEGQSLPLSSGGHSGFAVLPPGTSSGWVFGGSPPYAVLYQIAIGFAVPQPFGGHSISYVYPGSTVTIGATVTPALPSFTAQNNLLQNGNFQTGSLAPWVGTPSQLVQLIGGVPHSGNEAALLQLNLSISPNVTISQDITAPNTGWYVLAGYVAPSGIAQTTLGASVDGAQVASQTIAGTGSVEMDWQPCRMKFHADSGQTISV